MAMTKKDLTDLEETEPDEVEQLLGSLKLKIHQDRELLGNFLSDLLESIKTVGDPMTTISSADAVAKIGDALTRQNHLTIEAMKILKGRQSGKSDSSKLGLQMNRPFDDEFEKEGSN